MAIQHNSISGEESATITFKVRSVTVDMNSTVVHQEVLTLGDPESTLGLARVRAATPNSTDFGLVVRTAGTVVIEGNSTVVQGTSPWVVTGDSTIARFASGLMSSAVMPPGSSALTVRNVWSATHADQPVQATQSGTWNVGTVTAVTGITNPVTIQGNSSVVQSGTWNIATVTAVTDITNPVTIKGNSSVVQSGTWNIGTVTAVTDITNPVTIQGNSSVLQSGTWTVNVGAHVLSSAVPAAGSSAVVVRNVMPDLLTVASTVLTSTATTIASSAATRVRVVAYTITSTHTSPIELAFYQGSSMKWPLVLQAVSSAISGANLAVSAPAYLFQSLAGRPISLNTASTGVSIRSAVSYYVAP